MKRRANSPRPERYDPDAPVTRARLAAAALAEAQACLDPASMSPVRPATWGRELEGIRARARELEGEARRVLAGLEARP